MIQPPGWEGVAFSDISDGDLGGDDQARGAAADALKISPRWAQVAQVHGNDVKKVAGPGENGPADALWTTTARLPLAIFTADCFGVVLVSHNAVGVAHAGWRGIVAGIIERLRARMTEAGHTPLRAAVGPGIGPCCFEVGPEVAVEFSGDVSTTTWGTTSVNLRSALNAQLEGLETWAGEGCTRHGDVWFSHRENGTSQRMAALGWLP